MAKRKVHKHSPFIMVLIGTLSLLLLLQVGYSTLGANLGFLGNIGVSHYDSTLYGAVERDYKAGLAQKYTGAHQDSMDPSKSTKDIYYYYGNTTAKVNQIINHFNVKFDNYCWEILRTTDTGGVKLIYNGPIERGMCLGDRGTQNGASSYKYYRVSGNNYYSDSYSHDYDRDTDSYYYHLQGNLIQSEWNENTAESLYGKFTCMSDVNGNCENLYIPIRYYNNQMEALIFADDIETSSIGNVPFNYDRSSVSDAGYMFNRTLSESPYQGLSSSVSLQFRSINGMASKNYYYADSIRYDNGVYELYNSDNSPVEQLLFSENYNDLGGFYTCNGETTTCTTGYFITATTSYSFSYLSFTGGNLLSDVDFPIYISESVQNYQLVNPEVVMASQWRLVDSDEYKDHYICTNFSSTVCEDVLRIYSYGLYSFTGFKWSVAGNYQYASSFTYENGEYHLAGNVIQSDNFSSEDVIDFFTYPYSCLSVGDTCENLYFLTYTKKKDGDHYYYVNRYYYVLSNGESIADAIRDALYAPDVNQHDSIVKQYIEGWYASSNLSYYESYIDDDIVYCNNRDMITDIDEIGVSLHYNLKYTNRPVDVNFMCNRITDRFNVHNTSAPLKYPVALPTAEELQALGSNNLRNIGVGYLTSTPYLYSTYASNNFIGAQGAFNGTGDIDHVDGVRPVISIKPGFRIFSGDGSREEPYTLYSYGS